MHLDISPIPQNLWPEGATWLTHESRPILPAPRLGTAFTFETTGKKWWTDGGMALLGRSRAPTASA